MSPTDTLYHYCNLEAFRSIISNRCVWLCDLLSSNDGLEGRWIVRLCVEELSRRGASTNETKQIDMFQRTGAVGLCFSEDGDMLSQWRGYGDDGRGISIGFSRAYLKELCTKDEGPGLDLGTLLVPAVYETHQQLAIVSGAVDLAQEYIKTRTQREAEPIGSMMQLDQIIGEIYHKELHVRHRLQPHIYRLKHPGFWEEKEWRIIMHIDADFSKWSPGMLSSLQFRVAGGKLVPYVERKLVELDHRRPINEVVIGPKNPTPGNYVSSILTKHGFKDVNVRTSSSSYR